MSLYAANGTSDGQDQKRSSTLEALSHLIEGETLPDAIGTLISAAKIVLWNFDGDFAVLSLGVEYAELAVSLLRDYTPWFPKEFDFGYARFRAFQTLGVCYGEMAQEAITSIERQKYQAEAVKALKEARGAILDREDEIGMILPHQDPIFDSIAYQLALQLAEVGEISEAIEYANHALSLNPANVQSWNLLALLLTSRKDYLNALKVCEEGWKEALAAKLRAKFPNRKDEEQIYFPWESIDIDTRENLIKIYSLQITLWLIAASLNRVLERFEEAKSAIEQAEDLAEILGTLESRVDDAPSRICCREPGFLISPIPSKKARSYKKPVNSVLKDTPIRWKTVQGRLQGVLADILFEASLMIKEAAFRASKSTMKSPRHAKYCGDDCESLKTVSKTGIFNNHIEIYCEQSVDKDWTTHIAFSNWQYAAPIRSIHKFSGIYNKLYFTSLSHTPHQYPNLHFFSIDNVLVYINFYSDFGPSNLAHVIRFCEMMQEKFKRICLYSSMDSDKRANAAFLMCAYMMIVQKKTPDEAYQPLVGISQPFLPYRDAGYGAATYHITILDCLRGMYKALQLGLLDLEGIDPDEYEFYERVENGDFNWITDKFIAMASPKEDPPGTGLAASPVGFQQANPGGYHAARNKNTAAASHTVNASAQGYRSVSSSSPSNGPAGNGNSTQQAVMISQPVIINGKKQFKPAYRIDDLILHLKERGVTTVVRLNNKIYDRKRFLDAGLEHVELYFPDGSTPPDGILKRFLELCETRPGVIAVHCKAGLGRTGTLIGAFLMKHYKFTAAEVIGLLRVLRPGSVVGPQQNYLQSMQAKLWKMQPLTKLPQSISMLKTPTFPTSRRFPAADIFDTLEGFQGGSSRGTVLRNGGVAVTSATINPSSGVLSRASTPGMKSQQAGRIFGDEDVSMNSSGTTSAEKMLDNRPDEFHDELELEAALAHASDDNYTKMNAEATRMEYYQSAPSAPNPQMQHRPATSATVGFGAGSPTRPSPAISLGANSNGGGYYQALLESGRIDSSFDPMDYEASGRIVDGNLPVQPRKHASPASSDFSMQQQAASSQIRRELLSNALNGLSQNAKNQKVVVAFLTF
ncbi:Dual specificity protein phosphatase cdc14a [Phlyctochytrium bullatum]|nr:Dual specificity protein phosphatase cdc14a [Phlyctochytrium bullatum]